MPKAECNQDLRNLRTHSRNRPRYAYNKKYVLENLKLTINTEYSVQNVSKKIND